MIYNIKGKLTYIDAQFVVIECGGIGFKCFTSLNTSKEIGSVGSEANLFTYLSVKEDAMDLYGFKTQYELDCFKLLISVSGIGPKAAVSILSELEPNKLSLAIASGDIKQITKANGVGKKTAERIVLELKDKMANNVSDDVANDIVSATSVSSSNASQEAVEALVSLGYSQSEASVVVGQMDKSLSVDEMIRQGLKKLALNL